MNFTFERGDLLQLEPISNRGTLKLLPLGKKNKQKLVIGDDSGLISCYEFRKGEPQVVFQTKCFDGPITCVAVGGNEPKKDKIFASHNQRIIGLTKKGNDFFKLTSSLTETIQSISVEDTRIWTGCEFIYNLYDNGKDSAYFISKDKINDIIVAHLTREIEYDVVLACQDNCIRIIHGSFLYLEIPTANTATAVAYINLKVKTGVDLIGIQQPTSNKNSIVAGLVYGLETGEICMVRVRANNGAPEYEEVWTLPDDEDRRGGSVTCLKLFDINKDGLNEIIVGRDDGRIEVFKRDSIEGLPYKLFSRDIGESIRSVECGVVNSVDFYEIVVAAFSGKIISFTTEPVHSRAQEDNYGRSIQTINNENRIKFMRKEIEDLKKQVADARIQTAKKTSSFWSSSGSAGSSGESAFLAMDFVVNSKFSLDAHLAAYVLTIELQNPIDLVILRSPVVLHLVETDTGTSVLSITPPHLQALIPEDSTDGNHAGSAVAGPGNFVAVFRCQSQEKRIVLNLRTNEGEHGDLLVTIVVGSTPKAAKTLKYDLKPLSLSSKIHRLNIEEEERPKNKIKYTGNIPLAVCHEWVQSLFPDVPPRLEEDSSEQSLSYWFKNNFTGAVTSCEFRKNEIKFSSENASTIAIIKENITRLANYRRTHVEESMSTSEASIASFLSLISTKLDHQLSLTRKMQLVDAIQEIAMQDEESAMWLSAEYTEIKKNQETIRQDFKRRDKSLEYLVGIITDLFVDWNKLHGVDCKNKIPLLQQTVLTGTLNDILAAFFPEMVT